MNDEVRVDIQKLREGSRSFLTILLILFASSKGITAPAGTGIQPWTVADSVSIQHVSDWDFSGRFWQPFSYSRNGRLVAFVVIRPLVGTTSTEAALFVYRVAALRAFVEEKGSQAPLPELSFVLTSDVNRPSISDIQWSADDRQLGFIGEGPEPGTLYLWRVGDHSPRAVAKPVTRLTHFAFLGRTENVALLLREPMDEPSSVPVLTTGRGLIRGLGLPFEVPDVASPHKLQILNLTTSEIVDTGVTVRRLDLWPSPDGHHIAYAEPFSAEWKGHCWVEISGQGDPARWLIAERNQMQLAIFDLATAKVRRPFRGPTPLLAMQDGHVAGEPLYSDPGVYWSANGETAVAPYTLSTLDKCGVDGVTSASRAMVVRGSAEKATSLFTLQARPWEEKVEYRVSIKPDGVAGQVTARLNGKLLQSSHFAASSDGSWKVTSQTVERAQRGGRSKSRKPLIEVTQDYNVTPAVVVRSSRGEARRLYDLAPHLQGRQLGAVSEFSWTDARGVVTHGLLLFPANYNPGQGLPLIIQTHGFAEHEFYAGGPSSTAYPGRAIADRGFLVLAMKEASEYIATPDEATGTVGLYKSAIDALAQKHLIEPGRVGIVGYSRTTYHIDHALVFEPELFRAAVTGEGIDFGYSSYLINSDTSPSGIYSEFASIYGGTGRPWDDKAHWFARAPDLNAERMKTPLLIQAESGYASTAQMWQSYAALKMNNRAVELWTFPDGAHNLVRPNEQQASQQLTLDWLLFWLKGEEDQKPAKEAQYARWREMQSHSAE